jgi:hypothetical protein
LVIRAQTPEMAYGRTKKFLILGAMIPKIELE